MAATASTDDIWGQRLGFWYLAEDHPDALAIAESPDGVFTYAALAALAHQTVHALRSRGVPDGATVAVLAPNGILPIQVTLACQQAGWCLLLVNGYVIASEVIDILEHSGASVLVLHQQHQVLLEGEGGERISRLCDVLGVGEVPGAASLEMLLAEQPIHAPDRRAAGNMIAYSSGTTGAPKGILRPGAVETQMRPSMPELSSAAPSTSGPLTVRIWCRPPCITADRTATTWGR